MPKFILTQSRLKELLHYDPKTGIFTWKVNRGYNKTKNKKAGCFEGRYIKISINNKKYYAHSLAFLFMDGKIQIGVDHKDHNKINNKWKNLRKATQKENSKNQIKSKNNTTKVTGVYLYNKNKWRSSIMVNYKSVHLGCFENKNDAIIARKNAEKFYGFHKNHGASK